VIYGPINGNGIRRTGHNNEPYMLYDGPDTGVLINP